MIRSFLCLCLIGGFTGLIGCSPLEIPSAAEEPEEEVHGTLRDGVMAIGGETTGYVLETENGQQVEVDLSHISEIDEYLGRAVSIRGRFEERAYVERGPTRILIAEDVAVR